MLRWRVRIGKLVWLGKGKRWVGKHRWGRTRIASRKRKASQSRKCYLHHRGRRRRLPLQTNFSRGQTYLCLLLLGAGAEHATAAEVDVRPIRWLMREEMRVSV